MLSSDTTVLFQVIDGECSLSDLKLEATDLKQMRALKTAFLRLTNTDTWEDAVQKYPQFASEEQLRKFLRMDLNKSIPQPLADFCTRAKLSETDSESSSSSGYFVKYQQSIACVIEAKMTELSGHSITKGFASFKGANISIASLNEVSMVYLMHFVHVIFSIYFLGMHQRKRREPGIHTERGQCSSRVPHLYSGSSLQPSNSPNLSGGVE